MTLWHDCGDGLRAIPLWHRWEHERTAKVFVRGASEKMFFSGQALYFGVIEFRFARWR
jgi:hypothetical protein